MSKNEYTKDERNKIGRNAGFVGIGVNFLLFLAKFIVGITTGSISIMADAMNNLSDSGSSVIVTVGYALSGKPADRKHPYGHARFEYLSSLLVAIIVTLLGFEMGKSSVESFFSTEEKVSYGTLSIVIMICAAAVKLFLALFYLAVGRKISADAIKASAYDSFGDVGATAAVVIGMFLVPVFGPATDGVLGLIIAVYIFIMGVKLICESADTLLGTPPPRELVEEIVKKLKSYEGVLGIHDLVIHNYGESRFFASVHIEIDADEDILLSHDMIDNIENDFARDMGIELVIHLDPVRVGDERLAALKEKLRDIIDAVSSELSTPISMHDFRAVFGVTHTNLVFDVVIPQELPISEAELCKRIRDGISALDKSYNAVIRVDRDYTSTIY